MNNVVALNQTSSKPLSEQWIERVSASILKGDDINIDELWAVIDWTQDNSVAHDTLIKHKLISKQEWKQKAAQDEARRKTQDLLGFIPTDAYHFVHEFIKQRKIDIDDIGMIVEANPRVYVDGHDISHMVPDNAPNDDLTALYSIGKNNAARGAHELTRDLHVLGIQCHLNYRESDLRNIVEQWYADRWKERQNAAVCRIRYDRAAEVNCQSVWEAIEADCFNVDEAGFAIAILKKFIWQVKRKGFGHKVTYHMMPVITGIQGKGKSEFLHRLVSPLAILHKSTDFGQVTDGKSADLWNQLILSFDEMSNFSKANLDDIKRRITDETVTFRPMRSNGTVTVKQKATFIGCSNSTLKQIARDATGMRRFVEIEWSIRASENGWAALQNVDWVELWRSVDENGDDPSLAFSDAIKAQQEENRHQTPVEFWLRENRDSIFRTGGRQSDSLFAEYTDWEKSNFPNYGTNIQAFGNQLSAMVTHQPEFGIIKKRTSKGIQYNMREEAGK